MAHINSSPRRVDQVDIFFKVFMCGQFEKPAKYMPRFFYLVVSAIGGMKIGDIIVCQ